MSFGYDRQVEGSAGNTNEVVFIKIDAQESIQVLKGNGTTNFGRIAAGAAMGEITATGKFRPVGKQIVGATGSLTTVTMASVAGFFVGDVVTAYDVSGSATLATGRTVTAINPATPSLTISGGAITYDTGDYIYVEDGSATARGFLRDDVFTIDTLDENGAADAHDKGGLLVYQGVVDEDKADAVIKLNTYIKTDTQTIGNGCLIVYK
jgi:hypothetical protein